MYQDHFGLQRHLFEEGIAQGVDVFLGAAQKLAVTNLGVALTLRDSVAVLTGPSGVGKTTLAAHTLRSLTTRLALGWVGTAPATGHELLEMLLTEFGFSPYKNSRVERLQMWRQYLNEMRATDTRVCVLVESAENLQFDVLAALESLTAADPNGCPGANVVLTSRTGLTDQLTEPSLAALKQRTRLRWSLEPLTRAELRDYLAHCITAAGGKTLKLFTDEAVEALHQYSGGIIRTANNLSATALTLAASAREPQVNASLVTQVAVDVFGLAPAPAAAAAPWPAVAQAEPKAAQPLPPAHATPPPVTPAPAAPAPAAPSPTLTAPVRAAATPPPAAPPVITRPPPIAPPPAAVEPKVAVAPLQPTVPKAAVPPPTVASSPMRTPEPKAAPSLAPSQTLAARVAARAADAGFEACRNPARADSEARGGPSTGTGCACAPGCRSRGRSDTRGREVDASRVCARAQPAARRTAEVGAASARRTAEVSAASARRAQRHGCAKRGREARSRGSGPHSRVRVLSGDCPGRRGGVLIRPRLERGSNRRGSRQ